MGSHTDTPHSTPDIPTPTPSRSPTPISTPCSTVSSYPPHASTSYLNASTPPFAPLRLAIHPARYPRRHCARYTGPFACLGLWLSSVNHRQSNGSRRVPARGLCSCQDPGQQQDPSAVLQTTIARKPLSCFLASRGAHTAGLLEHTRWRPPSTRTTETTSNLSMMEEPRAGPTCRHGQLHPRCCSSASSL
jgi:hypothetical protein